MAGFPELAAAQCFPTGLNVGDDEEIEHLIALAGLENDDVGQSLQEEAEEIEERLVIAGLENEDSDPFGHEADMKGDPE